MPAEWLFSICLFHQIINKFFQGSQRFTFQAKRSDPFTSSKPPDPQNNPSTSKSLPPYDVLTVEDCLRWVGPEDSREQKFNKVFRILNNGLAVCKQELAKANAAVKVSNLVI